MGLEIRFNNQQMDILKCILYANISIIACNIKYVYPNNRNTVITRIKPSPLCRSKCAQDFRGATALRSHQLEPNLTSIIAVNYLESELERISFAGTQHNTHTLVAVHKRRAPYWRR